jgi:hypothetical protein
MRVHSFFIFPLLIGFAHAEVTVYFQKNHGPATTSTAAGANYTGPAAYNPTVLTAPPPPSTPNPSFNIQLQNTGTPGLSIVQPGAFFGFSIEFSVVNQLRECRSFLLGALASSTSMD